jgi:hypothetical protein
MQKLAEQMFDEKKDLSRQHIKYHSVAARPLPSACRLGAAAMHVPPLQAPYGAPVQVQVLFDGCVGSVGTAQQQRR